MQAAETKKPARESLARQIWLNYYNNYLREHGTISEEEWRKMRLFLSQS